MQLIDGTPVFSATDLVGYLACEHLTALERSVLGHPELKPHRVDRELDLIRRHGELHEARYLEQLEADGRRVVRIEKDAGEGRDRLERQARATVDAMASGADVIYQATFFDGRWLGYADFLLRVEADDRDRASVWGPYHYEVADTKLARHVKASAVLQICSYVEQLSAIQGVQPERLRVVLGGGRDPVELRVDDYMAYYRAARRRFEAAFELPPGTTYPEPVDHCDVCRWWQVCADRRREDDHLSLVAGISAGQRRALTAGGIDTVVKLANAPIPLPELDGASAAALDRIQRQAAIQVRGRAVAPQLLYELITPVEAERGLAVLPEPDPGDLFLDLEGDPYAFGDSFDYLFGLLDVDGAFTAIWSRDPDRPEEFSLAGEKAAFERVMDLITERLERYPNMHVYHYAAYEPTALKRLMGRHATREEAVDRLLRGGVLVDLFRAVRQGVRASVESYSIKRLEPLYGFERAIPLKDATSSIVAFEEWLQLADTERPSSAILDEIAAYNRDDVVSTLRLRDWLEARRRELETMTGAPVPRPVPQSPEPAEKLSEVAARVEEVGARLTDGVPADEAERSAEQQARWLLAQLLSWHRREMKATYWEFFHRIGMTSDELVTDDVALGRLRLIGPDGEPYRPTPKSKWRQDWRYAMPPQEHDIGDRSELYDPALQQVFPDEMKRWRIKGKLKEIDDRRESIVLTWNVDVEPQHPTAIVPLNVIGDNDHRAALLRLGEWVADHGVDADGPARAARDLLLRRPPRCGQAAGAGLKLPGESDLEAACRLALALDHSTLAIQGPPGSGKTFTGARMIVALLRAGKRVGISATSHKVITHFLEEVLCAADAVGGVDVRAAQKVSDGVTGLDDPRVRVEGEAGPIRQGLADGELNLVAGTSWLWVPETSDGLLDVLFVDEAGQISLANVVAMGGAADSLVLLGDPQQLDQPLQGSHPPGADRSALAHLLGEQQTMPPHLGLFLEDTWRMHPDITAFTSSAFYERRLESRPQLATQWLRAPAPVGGTGVRLITAEHAGADNASPEEAQQVADLVRALVQSGSAWTDADGEQHPLRWNDVLIVAPYNAQVGEIQRLLPDARVGTVDKFQGQQAPISIYSMTTSSPELAPRGMDFLYSRNRLNVATSRARCVAVVVASPELLRVRARTPEQMRLANALCQFVELAEGLVD
ncbi:MAG TPA: TM0106 family RecB-like putative nuclease [Candidatus Limnocylindria bacterium]|nr:TM0106 family RecB-like putative nuclease [Candidatus Limnocylindria bacterium]